MHRKLVSINIYIYIYIYETLPLETLQLLQLTVADRMYFGFHAMKKQKSQIAGQNTRSSSKRSQPDLQMHMVYAHTNIPKPQEGRLRRSKRHKSHVTERKKTPETYTINLHCFIVVNGCLRYPNKSNRIDRVGFICQSFICYEFLVTRAQATLQQNSSETCKTMT